MYTKKVQRTNMEDTSTQLLLAHIYESSEDICTKYLIYSQSIFLTSKTNQQPYLVWLSQSMHAEKVPHLNVVESECFPSTNVMHAECFAFIDKQKNCWLFCKHARRANIERLIRESEFLILNRSVANADRFVWIGSLISNNLLVHFII